MFIPSLLLKRLYTFGSLQNISNGVKFSIKNRLSDARLTKVTFVKIDEKIIPPDDYWLILNEKEEILPKSVTSDSPINFPLRQIVDILVRIPHLATGKHTIEIGFRAEPFGELKFDIEDSISEVSESIIRVPRDSIDDYKKEIIQDRQRFVEKYTGVEVQHIKKFSFDPHTTKGNIENFTGVAQVPLGFAGPLLVRGEHAQGNFLIPLATTEGTLVASYNRGAKLLNSSGGVMVSVVADAMQRAPVFVFENARAGREFTRWVQRNIDTIREQAEATSNVAKLIEIDPYLASRFVYLRFNFTTGDAAGQNMVGRATFAACSWIIDSYPEIQHFFLESNFATDKKASQVNIMRTRGKRVTAEAVVPRDLLVQQMRVTPDQLAYHYGIANVGSLLSGANNNGLHSANAITAIFIATGQDVANVAESSAGILYAEVIPSGDFYISITIPSLIVATYGGGTNLATQRECLEMLGAYGTGKVYKFAEIVAGAVLAGELSLGAAISSLDWVSSHEQYGRNR